MVWTVTLNPALDYVLKTENLITDDINRATEEKIFFGGKGINVSVILNRLGVKSSALGFVGGFTGEKLTAMLKKEGIICDFTNIRGDTRINVKIRAAKELDINANGPEITKTELQEFFAKLDKVKSGDYLVLSGSVPEKIPNDIYEKILKHLDGKDVNFVIDSTDKLLLNTLKYKPFLIKPNHHELGAIFNKKTETDEQIIDCAFKLQKAGAQNVLVSRAENGAILIDANGCIHKCGAVKGRLINSVGCGDSMVGGFIAGYIKENDFDCALKLGIACGCATAFCEGLADKEKIKNILNSF